MKKRISVLAFTALMVFSGACSPGASESNEPEIESQEMGSEQVEEEALPAAEEVIPTETEAPPEPTPTPVVLYSDDFTDPESGWERYNEFDGVLDYVEDGYRMNVLPENSLYWVVGPGEFGDLRIDTVVQHAGGSEQSGMGLMCRYDSEDFSFYGVLIQPDGKYGAFRWENARMQFLDAEALQQSGTVPDGDSYHIGLECSGEILRFYVNDELLQEVEGIEPGEGQFGLLARSSMEEEVDVVFQSVVVFEPGLE